MKSTKVSRVIFLIPLLASTAFLPTIASFGLNQRISGALPAEAGLQFLPLVQVSPDDSNTATADPAACTSPPPVHTSASFHCYTPTDIRTAYDLNRLYSEGITGAGETIVIVDAYGSPTALSDLNFFSSTFGLPAPDLTIVNPTGTPSFSFNMHGVQVGWAFETSLDLQWAHAVAPNAKLVLIEGNPAETEGVQGFPSIFTGEQFAVTHYPGSVMSQSFAVTEQSFHSAADVQVARFDQVYQQAASNFVTVLGSSGDTGTTNVIGGQGASTPKVLPFPTVNWPSSDPLVTSAGGTWLQFGWTWTPTSSNILSFATTPGSRTEAVWNEPYLPVATGGGRSVLFSTPGFQSSIPSTVLLGARGLPDVSWNSAVNGGVLVFTSFPGARVGWHTVGGTSAASPQLAGLVALTNQIADNLGKSHHVGYLNPLLYNLPSSAFHDIVPHTFGTVTLDSNALFGFGIAGMSTTAGWDLTTGFGSPDGHDFAHDLASALP